MSAKIDHIWKEGQELKWCPKCEHFLPLKDFHTTGNQTWDNLFYLCIECINQNRRNNPRRLALGAWGNICKRVSKNLNYIRRSVQIKITKEDFVLWYTQNWFPGCRVDRIDNEGHYELSNIQLLTQNEHNAKARQDRLSLLGIVEPDGMRWCYSCRTMKPNKDFYQKKRKVSKGNPLGLDEICNVCNRKKRMAYYYKS